MTVLQFYRQHMNQEIRDARTEWGSTLTKDFQERVLRYLQDQGTPQTSQQLAKALDKEVIEVEAALDLLCAANWVRYKPTQGTWAWMVA